MRFYIFTALLIVGTLFVVPLAQAAGIVPCDGPNCQTCDFIKLGTNILNWIIGIMATVCAIVIAVAGLKMVTAGGDPGAISSAKSMITNVIIGFVILLAAWLIVDTVMKVFVGDTLPGFGPWNQIQCVGQPEVVPSTPPTAPPPTPPVTTACTIPPLTPITDSLALQMEGGQTVIWNNDTLKACVTKFTGMVGGTVTSAYRPPAYQTHLWEIRDRWCTRLLKDNTEAVCSSLKGTVSGEVSKHFGSSWACGAVGQTSTHSSGIGVDITGISHGSASVQSAANASCLVWKNYQNDPYHYDLRSGCTCN